MCYPALAEDIKWFASYGGEQTYFCSGSVLLLFHALRSLSGLSLFEEEYKVRLFASYFDDLVLGTDKSEVSGAKDFFALRIVEFEKQITNALKIAQTATETLSCVYIVDAWQYAPYDYESLIDRVSQFNNCKVVVVMRSEGQVAGLHFSLTVAPDYREEIKLEQFFGTVNPAEFSVADGVQVTSDHSIDISIKWWNQLFLPALVRYFDGPTRRSA